MSLDVDRLFPSIPIPETLTILKNLLKKNMEYAKNTKTIFEVIKTVPWSKICQFGNKFYIMKKGTCVGNALSPFLANLFMSNFETNMNVDYCDKLSLVELNAFGLRCKTMNLSNAIIQLKRLIISSRLRPTVLGYEHKIIHLNADKYLKRRKLLLPKWKSKLTWI